MTPKPTPIEVQKAEAVLKQLLPDGFLLVIAKGNWVSQHAPDNPTANMLGAVALSYLANQLGSAAMAEQQQGQDGKGGIIVPELRMPPGFDPRGGNRQ